MTKREKIGRKFQNLHTEAAKSLLPVINDWMDSQRKAIFAGLNKFQKANAKDIVINLIDWEQFTEETERKVKPAILAIMAEAGDMAISQTELQVAFDIVNERAVKVASQISAKMVREVTDETQAALRHLITEGIKTQSMPKIAMQIRPLVGLTERQTIAVANFEEHLLITRPELSQARVDKMISTYEKRMHNRRADMISRTEAGDAVSEGSLLGYEQAGLEEVEINAAAEHCAICDQYDGKRYKLEDSHGVLLIHPNCRCSWIPVVK